MSGQQVSSQKKAGFTSYTDGFEPEDGANRSPRRRRRPRIPAGDKSKAFCSLQDEKLKCREEAEKERWNRASGRAHNDKVYTEERVRAKEDDEWEKTTNLHGVETVEDFEKEYDESVKALRGSDEEQKPEAIEDK